MGAISGSISYALYYVKGELPDHYKDDYLEKIREFAFRELTPESEEEESVGWVTMGELLNTEFPRDDVFRESYVCLSMRMDRWSLPAQLFKAIYERRAREVADERGKPKLSRTESDALKDTLRREFKSQSLPAASMVDVVWNVDEQTVRFWSHAQKKNEIFAGLFESTFDVRLFQHSPYIASRQLDLEKEAFTRLGDVEQEDFASYRGDR